MIKNISVTHTESSKKRPYANVTHYHRAVDSPDLDYTTLDEEGIKLSDGLQSELLRNQQMMPQGRPETISALFNSDAS